MSKYILGFHGGLIGHDPNICVLDIDSNHFIHIEEERLSRIKYGRDIDESCITKDDNCVKFIKRLGIEWSDIEFIVYGRDLNCHPNNNLHSPSNYSIDSPYTQEFNYHKPIIGDINLNDLNKKMFLYDHYKIRNYLNKDVYFLNHHIAHGAYSYFTSQLFEESIIFSYDGVGYEESFSMSMLGKGNSLSEFRDYPKLPIGFWYYALSQAIFKSLGKVPIFWEGKTMALSSYGEPIYLDAIRKKLYVEGDPFRSMNLIKLLGNNNFASDILSIISYFEQISDINKLRTIHCKMLDISYKKLSDFKFVANIACSWQTYIEELVVECMIMLRDHYNIRNLCIGGGCGLNGIINYKLQEHFDNVYIPPATSDCGLSIGCALYGKHVILNKEVVDYGNIAFKGLFYHIEESFFDKYDVKSEKVDYHILYKRIAKYISEGKIIGWYQGRSESGPRALGNRSILADPTNKQIKEILNKRVKHREWFRPFAPSILKEYVGDYFDHVTDEKYMLKIAKVKKDKLDLIPSVIHIDNTARLQTVSLEDNKHFYNLIKAFYNITNVPILLNTSFNVAGEPIVESPKDALDCFVSTEIDVLVLQDYIIFKNKNK